MVKLLSGIATWLLPGIGFAAETSGEAQSPAGGVLSMVAPMAIIIVFFYFFAMRPQKKKQQQHDQMLASIKRGDTVVTAGGFFGRVSEILDDSYIIELADGVRARILKGSVSSKREGGDDKNRPRKLRKKKRLVPKDATPETGEAGEAPKSIGEGVTARENEVLIEGLASESSDEKETSSESGQ